MGSSKTGSLDKFVPFSPAAAFGSGKVKLPETGLIGMMQQGQEDKMAMNAANIAAQQKIDNQKAQQAALMETMRSRMQGGQGTPLTSLFMKEGGHVALRRKMFKLGGSANAHGVGLTSGLSFNQGGRVGMKEGGDAALKAFLRSLKKGAGVAKKVPARSPAGAAVKGLGFLTDLLIPGSVSLARRVRRPSLIGRNLGTAAATIPILGGAAVGIGASRPGGLESLINPEADTTLQRLANLPTRAGQLVGETATEIPARLLDALASVNIPDDPDGTTALSKAISGQGEFAKSIEKALYGREKTPEEKQIEGENVKLGMTPGELSELAAERQREDLEAAMAMYQDLIRGEDNTNRLATLGDAAIAAGSALMEGEGYGGAAAAFNQPLAQARAAQRELDQTARGAAAQLAIGEDIARRQQDEALAAELLATGQFDTAEEINQIVLARKFGISRVLPEDDKGEVDTDALNTAGAGVYVDPKTRFGGIFVAIDSDGEDLVTNDPEAAKQHAKG